MNEDTLAHINYKLLKAVRKRRRLSIEKASVNIIDPYLLRKAENEEIKITLENLRLLADRYRVNFLYFYYDEKIDIKSNLQWFISDLQLNIVKYLIKKWKLDDLIP